VLVERLQRLDRPVDVAEFGVVIVFDDGGVVVLCPGQQRAAPRHGQRHAQRELMRGRDVDDAGFRR